MKNNKPTVRSIAQSIQNQIAGENGNRYQQQRASARFNVELESEKNYTHVWISGDYKPGQGEQFVEEGSQFVNKNSSLGRVLLSNKFGTYRYKGHRYGTNKLVERYVTFNTKSVFNNGREARDVSIEILGEPRFQACSLKEILKSIEKQIDRENEELKRIQQEEESLRREEQAKKEAIAKAERDEAERLRKEAERIAEEKRLIEEQRKQLEKEIIEGNKKIEDVKKSRENAFESYRSGLEIRVQEIVDESQNEAKFCHLYDGVTVVIDGGPGTGKTTTFIQRLKLLIDPLLKEHDSCALTEAQIEDLTNSGRTKDKWIFISPSDLLAEYLKSALSAEGLANDIKNIIPYHDFLSNRLESYYITKSTSSRPTFAMMKPKHPGFSKSLIRNGKEVFCLFSKYLCDQISKPFIEALNVKTNTFSWNNEALRIKVLCKKMENVKSIMDIVRILEDLRENDSKNLKEYRRRLSEAIDLVVYPILKEIKANEDVLRLLNDLFMQWEDHKDPQEDLDIYDLSEEEEPVDVESLEIKINKNLKILLKRLGIGKLDPSYTLSKKNKELYDVVKDYVNNVDLTEVADLAWFDHNFGKLCTGITPLLLNRLLQYYKKFRTYMLETENQVYNIQLLREIVTPATKKNRLLHRDEQSFLLGFINTLLLDIRKNYNQIYNTINHHFVEAYKLSTKHVIGVDEASDYSELDYWCLKSFRDPEYYAITLCGDVMQGLSSNGIKSWDQLRDWVFPELDVFTLKISYRQWPALLEVAQRMYKDDLGFEAPYKCHNENKPRPSALAFISDSEDEKIEWIAERISKVFHAFNTSNEKPSIAVFINENEDSKKFVDALQDTEWLENYIVDDCTNDKHGRADRIRVFHLSKVKGLEFEAAFFHNIDSFEMSDESLLRRYLYVGISRAVSHMGATFSSYASPMIKYFETGKGNWEIK